MSSGLVLYHPVVKTPTPWEGGRVYRCHDPCDDGDGYWTGDWHYTRIIVHAAVFGAHHVEMHLRIGASTWFDPKQQKTRRQKRRCTVTLRWDQAIVELVSFTAKTVAFAQQVADALIITYRLRELYQKVYAAEHATCVYDASGNPLASFFGGERSSEIYKLPSYNVYYTVNPAGRMRRINMIYCGYTSTGLTADADDFVKPGGVVFAEKPWNGVTSPERKPNG